MGAYTSSGQRTEKFPEPYFSESEVDHALAKLRKEDLAFKGDGNFRSVVDVLLNIVNQGGERLPNFDPDYLSDLRNSKVGRDDLYKQILSKYFFNLPDPQNRSDTITNAYVSILNQVTTLRNMVPLLEEEKRYPLLFVCASVLYGLTYESQGKGLVSRVKKDLGRFSDDLQVGDDLTMAELMNMLSTFHLQQ